MRELGPGIDPGRLVDDHVSDIGVKIAGLGAHWTGKQRNLGVRERGFDRMDRRRCKQDISQVVETHRENALGPLPLLVDHRDRSISPAATRVAIFWITFVVLRPSTSDRISIAAPTSRTASISGSPSAV